MSIRRRHNKKLIIFILLMILIMGIGAVSAADNATGAESASSNHDKLSLSNDAVELSASNEAVLNTTVDFSGSTFTELDTAIANAEAGDVIVLNNDITNNKDSYMLIDKQLTIEGNGHTIDALGQSGIFFIKGENVVLNNITFTNAKNHYPGGDNMYGGAVCWFGFNGTVNNSVFTNNIADPDEPMSGYGGAIDWIDGIGGKIYNSKFYNNYANKSGGALRVKADIIIDNSVFSYNDAPDGGAIYVVNQGANSGAITRCVFTHNSAKNKGGAVYFYSNAVTVRDNYFTQNSAKYGGAIYAYANNDLFLDNQTVVANFAEYGGGFYLDTYNYCPVKVRYSKFFNNTAYESGAGVYYYHINDDVGYSDVVLLNSDQNTMRYTVEGDKGYLDWVISDWQHPIVESYFGGSIDNYLGVRATPEDTTVVIDVSIPKDADQATADITLVITDESGIETTYHYDPSDSRWNYDNVNHSVITLVTLTLTNQHAGDYFVNATFKDNLYYVYEKKGNTTYTIKPKIKGNFTILQEIIDEAINNKTYVVDLDRDYTYSIGLDHGQMNIYENLTINGNGHFLDALGYCRIFAISGDNVVLNNILFTNGESDGVDGTLEDHDNGGAIFWFDVDNATVNNCTFTNNNATNAGAILCGNAGSVYINNTIFTYNTANEYGGAIHLLDNDKATVSGCTFRHNEGNDGGAINCNSSNCRIDDCDFTQNAASYCGGAIGCYARNSVNVTNSNFINNTADGNGGAIDWYCPGGIIDNCNFTDNGAASGGAIGTYDTYGVTISNNKFTRNHADENGGAIDGTSSNTSIHDCTFEDNHAANAGAVLWKGADTSLYDCVFTENYASNNGGALSWDAINGTVHDSIFENNHADYGGAAYWESSDAKIYACNFTDNYANQMGGAVQFWQSDNINVSDSNFTGNSAIGSDGGAIIFSQCSGCNVSGSSFIANIAENQGGAIYWSGNNGRVSKSNFKNNNATFGSAINWDGAGGKVMDSSFLDNKADSMSLAMEKADLSLTVTFIGRDNYINAIYAPNDDLTFENVVYFNGSVVNTDNVPPVKSIYEVGQSVELKIYEGTALKETVSGITDANGQFIYDYSQLDCGIYSYTVTHSEDTYYTAVSNESDFKFGEFDLLQHEVNKAEDNSVLTLIRNYTYTIGVDTITDGVVINKKNLTINGNNHTIDALYKSRIFYVNSEDVVLNNITYVNGTANYGGAIFADTSAENLIISNATFEKNVANVYAAAVFWDSPSGNINHALFNDNRLVGSSTSGGAVYWNATNCNISYASFTNNYAKSHGGALYSAADTTALDNVNFTDNSAGNNGGAVWIKADSTVTNSNFISNDAQGSGGAIWFESGNTVLDNVNFTQNYADGTGGGAILIYGTSAIISNVNFSEDYAKNDGGAIYMTTANSRIENSTFEGTHAMNGGAINWLGQSGTIYNTTFAGTYSGWRGGAINWEADNGNVTLVNFTDVRSGGYGGAVYWSGSNGNISLADFSNATSSNGGAIYLSGSGGKITKSKFNVTNAVGAADSDGGGAIHLASGASNAEISECDFTNAYAVSNGAAILSNSYGTAISDISVNNSNALRNGGAIYLAGGASDADLTDISIFNTSASNGGGLYVNAKDVTFSNSNITNSSAFNGGALYWSCSGGDVHEVILANNTADNGGALYAKSASGDYAGTTLSDVTFSDNEANVNGGAICFDKDAGGYSVFNSEFTNNAAADKGNSIYYNAGSSDTLNNSVYNSNFTGTNHIYIENSMRATLENNTELNPRNGDYFVYNRGTIALSKNDLNNLIVNYGTILTQVNVTVCDNRTYTFDDIYFPLNATVIDDNGNTIVSDSLVFTTNHNDNVESEIEDDMHVGTLITNKEYYVVNVTDAGLKKAYVKIAIINVIAKPGSYTWLQKEIDNLQGSEYVLLRNVTFDPVYDLSIYNMYYGRINFTNGMNYNKTFTLEGSNFTISGLNQARIFTVTADNIVINNTNFINGSTQDKGGALYITSDDAKIANSTFMHNNANSGGAITSVSNSGLTLDDLSFIANTAVNIAGVELSRVSGVQISDLDFTNNHAANDCGAMSFVGSGSTQTLSDCSFTNNTAGNNYGAVYVSNVNVDSCSFTNNTAEASYSALCIASGSSALTLTASNFTGNHAGTATVGIKNANAKVSYCNFTDNKADGLASAIYVNATGVTLSNDTFDKNIAGANGTVWFASTSGKILDCNFTGNRALNGAAIYADVNENILVANSSFISNIAGAEAGALYFASQYGKIQYCNFTDNSAVNGGAVVIAGSYQDIGYCNFIGNNATSKGGSIYVKHVLNNNVHDSTFENGYAFDGGAVYNSGSTGASLRLFNDTFIKNIASHNGGAVYYIVDADSANPVIYRDYLNFTADGITSDGVVDSSTGRTTVTMKSSGSTYQRIVDCRFVDNMDYVLNVTARVYQDTLAVVYIYNPKDADEKTVRIVVTINSTDGNDNRKIIINETNYDYYFNTYSKSFDVNFYNLTEDMDYKVNVSFEDKVYLYKYNTTDFRVNHGDKIGEFKYLQRLINYAIGNATPGEIPVLNLERNVVFTLGTESWCDDSCVNITSPIIINGYGHTIDALGQCRIFNITAANVTLNDIKFVNGNSSGTYGDGVDKGGAIYWNNENGTLTNCEFMDNVAEVGGGIYYNSTAGHAKISGCYFMNNTAAKNGGAIDCNAREMNLTNTFFESNNAGEYGAALCREINATGGFGKNNNFTSNVAGIAGAALGWMGVDNVTIDNYIFIDNIAGENGGAIYVSPESDGCKVLNSVFEGNHAVNQFSGNGGAIDWLGTNGTVFNSNFTNNNAFDGGAIFVGSATGHTNITGSTFTGNSAHNNGGAINMNASSVTLNASNFHDNYADKNGGALYVGGEGITNYVSSSTFVNNSAENGRGGAIDWVAATGEITDSEFRDNSAVYGGGVYFGLKSRDSKIENVIFTNNSAVKNGGAIDWNSTGGQLYNTQFISNYAGEYGAALCREANATQGHGNNNTFTSNHAGIAGAALAWMDSVGISITNYNFTSNTADVKGGAIYINPNSHNCSIIDCKFDYNEVNDIDHGYGGAIHCEASNATIKGSSFSNNFAFEGGAIYVDSYSGSTNISDSKFTMNRAIGAGGAINLEASSVNVTNSEFTYNIATDGGALYVGGEGVTNYVYNSYFGFNDASSGHGGAIGWLSSTGHIINSNFTSNSAEYGGGVYLNGNSSESQISGSRFIGNIANSNGGAIDWNATSGDLLNNYFYSNYAGEYGAALCREANATGGHGYNNTFEYNYAEIAGAALAWMNVGNIKIDTYYFYNNMAGLGGAAIYIGYGSDNSTILNCDFRGNNITNETGGYGGAIYSVAENTTINNTNFTNNNAYYGGAICVGSGSGDTKINSTNFTDNHAAADGGALYLKSSSVLNNTVFKQNTANNNGGAIFVDGVSDNNHVYSSVFEENHANNGRGGAINWGSSAGHIVDSNFTLNTADYGGGVYLGGNSINSRITDVVFENNTATYNGGAIDWNATGGNLTHTIFKYNLAQYGAALCREANATGGFGYNNTFIANHAYRSGSALAWMGVDNITIRSYTFTNNSADYSGGAIYVALNSDNCKVINSTFTNNSISSAAVGRGGDIDWIGDNAYVFNTTFTGSFSPMGGSIYLDVNSNNATIVDSSFTSCTSLSTGGAIHVCGENATVIGSNFTSSFAKDSGGAIAGISSDNLNITYSNFKYNVAAGHIDPQGVHYGEGGAIYCEDSRNLRVSHSTFETDEAKLSGGSISADNCNDSVVFNITTYDETAFRNGGSISWINSRNVTIDGSYFNDTGANYFGGTLYFSNVDDIKIKNTGINSSWASWEVGGAIYIDGNVTVDNVTFNDTHSYHDNATAIYFNSGISTVSNSTFENSVKAIGIAKDANVTLIRNNLTSDNPTKDTKYLTDISAIMVDTVDYAVWNEGNLWLDKNNFDNVIFNNGTIWTKTYLDVLGNQSLNTTWNTTFTFWANITDDNNNTVISVRSLDTWNNITGPDGNRYPLPYNRDNIPAVYQGSFQIFGYDYGLKDVDMRPGTLSVRMPVKVEVSSSQPTPGQLVITATIKPEVQSNYTIQGQKVYFKVGDREFNATILECDEKWTSCIATYTLNNLSRGTYTISATYNGDDVHLNATGENTTEIIMRESWIKVAIQNITYGETAVAVITTNSNGTVRINIHGKDEIIVVDNMHQMEDGNYTGSVEITVDDYNTTGRHDAGVVLEANNYYKPSTNLTSFYVYKLNTTIVAVPTSIIVVGDTEKITVKVNENATKFVRVIIDGKTYDVEELDSGMATFEIPNLPYGRYDNVIVEYLGDDYFNGNSTRISFTVNRIYDYVIEIRVENIKYGENATIYAALPSDVTNDAVFVVNGTPYPNIKVVNGIAQLVVPNLDVGEYPVIVVYPGDSKYESKNNRSSFNVTATDEWTLDITVEAHTYGENTTFNVTLPQNATKEVNLTIEGVNYTVQLTDGKGNLTLNNISGGFHTVVASYPGDDRYLSKTNSTAFFIDKAQSGVNITQNGRNVTATVTVNATGQVIFIVNGKIHRAEISDGNATWANILVNGNNTVVVIYEGDKNFTDSNNATNLTVPLEAAHVNVTGDNVTYGNVSEITVEVPVSQTGYVRIVIENANINVTVPIDGGMAKFNATGLNAGEYLVNVTYLGDKVYDVAVNSTHINITKANLTVSVIAQNVTVKENASFVITVNTDFKGKVNITVNDESHFDGLVEALIYINRLSAGNYTASMNFYGDNNYNNKTVEVDFTVSRVDPTITVTVPDATYPNNATATVRVSGLANGTVNITVDGGHFVGTVSNGEVIVNLSGLAAGSKVALVNFTTSDDYNNNATITTKFTINKANSTVIITNSSRDVIATVTDGATGTVTFFVNGRNKTVDIVGRTATWQNALEIGNNTVVAIYNGDGNYNFSQNSTAEFTVPKRTDSKVNVTATSVVYGNVTVVTVKVPTAQKGYVTITINGTKVNLTSQIVNGEAKFNVTGLDAGKYKVNVTYLGDDTYDAKMNSSDFNVYRANLNVSVVALNVTVNENASFIVNVNDDYDGTVQIDSYYTGEVKPLIVINRLDADTYNVNVVFSQTKNYNGTTIPVTFTVSRVDPTITVIIPDATYPNNATATVRVSGLANGTVNITVDGKHFAEQIRNGEVEINLTGLTAGSKEALVNFTSTTDKHNNNATVTVKFVINKANSTVTISNSSRDVIATVTPGATGTVTFYVNGRNETRPVVDGSATFENALVIGNNTVVAVYNGDVNFTVSKNSTNEFTVSKRSDALVNVTATSVVYGNVTVVTVKVPTAQKGYATITINGTKVNLTSQIVNGEAKFNVTGLDAGKYKVNVTYLGDDTYDAKMNSSDFNVYRANLNAAVIAQNVTVKENATFIISINGDYKGTVNINGTEYNIAPLITTDKLAAGTYTIEVKFNETKNYNATTVKVTFTVSRVAPTITVTIPDATYPGNATATVIVSDLANGTVNITVGSEHFVGTVKNGTVIVNLTGLTAGSKEATVNFTSSDKYNDNATVTTKFTINKANSTVIISNSGSNVTATVTPGATGNVTFYINGNKYSREIDANGNATAQNILEYGNNTIVVVYEGDGNYLKSSNSTAKIKEKVNPNIKVNVTTPVNVFDEITINITGPKDIDGFVTIEVANQTYAVIIKDGSANITISGLKEGTYDVNVTYIENSKYFTENITKQVVVNKVNSTVIVETVNVTVGKNPIVNVTLPDDATGNITIKVGGYEDTIAIHGGLNTIIIPEQKSGKYDVNVTYNGNDKYNSNKSSARLNVSDVGVSVDVIVENITYGETEKIIIFVNATGKVNIKVNGTDVDKNLTIDNGKVIFEIPNLLDANKYTVNVTAYIDGNEKTVTASEDFEVAKATPMISVDVKDIIYGGVENIVVHSNVGGKVNITVDGRTVEVDLNNGHEELRASLWDILSQDNVASLDVYNLDVGKYPVVVKYLGSENYNEFTVNAVFIVVKANSTSVEVEANTEMKVGESQVINITLSNKNATGDVIINIDGVNDTSPIKEGFANYTVGPLSCGNHTVTVYYPGDNNTNANFTSIIISVSREESSVTVEVTNRTVGNAQTVIVNVPESATGQVLIDINDYQYYVNVTGGAGKIDIERLSEGYYNLTATYLGDENYASNSNVTRFYVAKNPVEITVNVANITEGSLAIVNVTASGDAYGNVTIQIGEKSYVAYISNGQGIAVIPDLGVGNYTINATYNGNYKYLTDKTNASFSVNKVNVTEDVRVIDKGNGTVVVVVSGNATGNVTVKVGNNTYNATVTNGTATITITNETPGVHEIEVIYTDTNGTNTTVYSDVVIPKHPSQIDVEVTQVMEGETATVTIRVPENATGSVVVTLDGRTYPGEVGEGGIAVVEIANITAGDKSLIVEYSGDGNYTGNYSIRNFTVEKAKVHTEPVVIDQGNGTIVVVIGDNATGNVTVKVGENTYNATVINGTAVVNVDNETPGTHEIEVIYSGDGNHTNSTVGAAITVPKYDCELDVTVSDIANGTAKVTIRVPENATGDVSVRIDGMNYTGHIKDGEAVIDLVNLTGGAKTLIVEYSGDDNYSDNYTVVEFIAEGAKVTVEPIVIDHGNGTITVVIGDNATGNVTVKVGDNIYNATVINGTATVTVDGNVTPGTHEIEVIYSGDGTHNGTAAEANITVPKYDSEVGMTVVELDNGTVVVTVTVPEDATGEVIVSVGGKEYVGEVEDGIAVVYVDGLSSGNQTIVAEYSGDNNYSANYTISNLTKEAGKAETDPTIIDYGNGTVVVVIGDNATGNVTVKVGNETYVAEVINGTATVTVDGNVTPGTHEIEVIYSGDGTHNGTAAEANITVPKYDSEVGMTVVELDNGTVVVTVTVPEDATGEVIVSVGGKEYVGEVEDGIAVVYVDGLSSGNQTIVAEYSGDNNYSANYTISNLTKEAGKAETDPTVIDYGNGTVVVVIGDNATGNVTVKVGNETYVAEVINGTATVTVDGNVTPGTHEIEVIYSGDDTHSNSTSASEITAPKYDSQVNVTVSDIRDGTATVTVRVPANATGNVTVRIDGMNYTAEIRDGEAIITLENLTDGAKTFIVEYSGDENYSGNYTVYEFMADGAKTDVEPVIVDYGNGTVVVVVGDNATGNVTVKVGNETYNAEVINGTATITLDNLTPGAHEIEVIYSGDENHANATVNAGIEVSDVPTPIAIAVDDINVGDRAIVTVEVAAGATGTVTIEIDGVQYTAKIDNGIARFEVENLTAGEKSVSAVYEGDGAYAGNFTTAQFEVSKVDSNLIVVIRDAYVGENVTVEVIVPEDATGQVLIDIDGVGYYLNVTNGTGSAEIPRLCNGTYNVTLTYTGDGKYLSSSNTTTFRVSKLESFVIPIAGNIRVGENENIHLLVPLGATGNVTVIINGAEYSYDLSSPILTAEYSEGKTYTVAISGGEGELVISGLPQGEYLVSVRYNGDYMYLPSENSTVFTVSKQSSQMEVVDLGNGTVKVLLPENATGRVTLNDGTNTYVGDVVNGTASFDLTNTTPGTHEITVNYTGDKDYSSNATGIVVDVPKYDTPIAVEVSDINVGETETVTVTLPEKATGTVTIEINGRQYSAEASNGRAVFSVDGLAFGNKTVAVKYLGDDSYAENFTTGQFAVLKVPSTVSAQGKDIKVGKDEVITVTVPADATGQVLVDIDGVGYYATVTNGKAKVIVPELPSGKYAAYVTYEGDDKYLPSTTAVSFRVSKSSAPISISGDEVITQGEDATVIVHLPEDATGTVTITVDGRTYTTEVRNGKATFVIPGLTRGDHDITASYSGDRKYEANDTLTDIDVLYNETPEEGQHEYHHGGVDLTRHATANPLLALLVMVFAVGTLRIRRF